MTQEKWVYSDTVKEHFTNPQNILEDEKAYQADGKGYVGNPACGDMMLVVIKVDEASQRIIECKWKTYGCASAIASTSMMSVMLTENGGMSLDDAYALTPQKILERLGSLPKNKIHCSVLGDRALRDAIEDYYRRSGQIDKIRKEEATVVCECIGVTDHDIEDAVLEGADTYERLQELTKVGTGCGRCKTKVEGLLNKFIEKYANY